MQRAGSESWSFTMDVGQVTHAVLFVRDAIALSVTPASAMPPRLSGEVPDRRAVLERNARDEAALYWPSWWNVVLVNEARRNLSGPWDDVQRGVEDLAERTAELVDPPGWASLADRPGLQAAAKALYFDGCRWADAVREPLLPPSGLLLDWELTRDIAQGVAADLDVNIGALRACAIVLEVEGRWWTLHSRGVVVCSVEAARSPGDCGNIIRRALTSSVTGD